MVQNVPLLTPSVHVALCRSYCLPVHGYRGSLLLFGHHLTLYRFSIECIIHTSTFNKVELSMEKSLGDYIP